MRGSTRWRTRFAPAPTGYLHLGHLVNAMHVWGVARAHGGDVVLRVEDHDRTRCQPEYEAALLDDLDWLGLEPDVGPASAFRAGANAFRQSDNDARYADALEQLSRAGHVFACTCTRRDIAAIVGARENAEAPYPGTCRSRDIALSATLARRVRIPDEVVHFTDLRLGQQAQQPLRQCGDLLVRDRLGQWTYQFAVVVDDIAHEIDIVIRGEDLLDSTGRQVLLARMLGRTEPPRFLHHALIRHPDGTKLSKSNRDTALRELRADGFTREQLFGMAAAHAGLQAEPRPISFAEIVAHFAAQPFPSQRTTPSNPSTTSSTHCGPL